MTIGIGRRQFISALGGAAAGIVATARRARSQTPKPLRVGIVHPVSPKGVPPSYVAFLAGCASLAMSKAIRSPSNTSI